MKRIVAVLLALITLCMTSCQQTGEQFYETGILDSFDWDFSDSGTIDGYAAQLFGEKNVFVQIVRGFCQLSVTIKEVTGTTDAAQYGFEEEYTLKTQHVYRGVVQRSEDDPNFYSIHTTKLVLVNVVECERERDFIREYVRLNSDENKYLAESFSGGYDLSSSQTDIQIKCDLLYEEDDVFHPLKDETYMDDLLTSSTEYTNDMVTKTQTYDVDDQSGEAVLFQSIEYDLKQRVIANETFVAGLPHSRFEYEYDDANRLIRYGEWSKGDPVILRTIEFIENGRQIETTIKYANNTITTNLINANGNIVTQEIKPYQPE